MAAAVASPDLPAPVALTLHEVTETQLVDAMVAALQIALAEWEPQEGATEVLLMETVALTMGQFIFALNQLPRVVLDGLVALHGVRRKDPVAATGQVTVTVTSSTIGTQTLPAGARFRVTPDGGSDIIVLTAEAVSINPADDTVATVNVVAEQPGTAANGVPAGTEAIMVDAYTWVESAVLGTTLAGGGDTEPDEAFYSRAAAELQGISLTLVTDAQFATAALRNDAVGRAKAFGLWDGVGAVGTMQGHITVAVAAPDGSNTTGGVKAAVLTALTAGALSGLVVHVVDFARVNMNLGIIYTPDPLFLAAAVSVAIETELRAWLNPATWPLADTLTSVNQIILRIGRVPGVANVTAVTGWAPITGGATLPTITTLTITTT